MKKILCVFGTRPEAIKMSSIILALQKHPDFALKVCVTAQHRSMLDQILQLFDIKPDYDLDIMTPGQSLHDISTKTLSLMPEVLNDFQPQLVLVQGDTTTTFMASLAAFYQKIAVGHIEAGLRTQQKYAPWPEEINRRLTTHLADWHFAPTLEAKHNLLQEGIDEEKLFITGNTVIDALLLTVEKLNTSPALQQRYAKQFAFLDPTKKLILVTGHRRENFGEGFENICLALREMVNHHPDIQIIYPVHLNPQVQKPVKTILSEVPNIFLIEPLDYLPFVYLLNRCYLTLTDSGGIQEEAPALGKPVLVMRNTTERPEGLQAGTAILVGTTQEKIISATHELLTNPTLYKQMSCAHNPYGDGTAAQQIIEILAREKL